MKLKFFLLLFITQFISYSQTEVYFFKDISSKFNFNSIKEQEFKILDKQILDPYTQYTYWFKIPTHKTNTKYIFRILYERISNADAFQDFKKINKLQNQRFLSYKFSRNNDVYIKIKPKLHAYIPIEFMAEESSIHKENNHLLLNGFYYGFAFLVIVFNLLYFFVFKDDTFLYYSLFLASMSFGVFTMDGMLNYLKLSSEFNNLLMILNYIFLGYFSSKFANNYLFLENYYPKLKRFSYVLGLMIILSGLIFLITENFYFLLFVNIFLFSLFLIYWFCSVLLFKENIYTKILAFAYIIILFSGIDFFILKFFGVSVINVNSTNIKVGAFLEMIILSIAVLYRVKVLKDDNNFMRNEIINYSANKSFLNDEKDKEELLKTLSSREQEIFNLVAQGFQNKEIANKLTISINTVKFHIKNIYEKLEIKSRKEVIRLKNSLL